MVPATKEDEGIVCYSFVISSRWTSEEKEKDSPVSKEVVISTPEKALKAILDGLLNFSELKFLMVLQLSFMLEEIEEIQEIGRILLVSSNSEPH
jgi:hypothetical protein